MDLTQGQMDLVRAGIAAAHKTILDIMTQAYGVADAGQVPDGQRLHEKAWIIIGDEVEACMYRGDPAWTTADHYADAAAKLVNEKLKDYRWTG